MSNEQSAKPPWYSRFENLTVIIGAIFLLCALGALKIAGFEFHPSEDIPRQARFAVFALGLVVLLAGVTLHLHDRNVWSTKLGLTYFSLTLLVAVSYGVADIWIASDAEPRTPDVRVRSWTTSQHSFEATVQILPNAIKRHQNKSHLLVVCRKRDPSWDFEMDTRIVKSRLYMVDAMIKDVEVLFDTDFSGRLSGGDAVIECAVLTLPLNVSRDSIGSLADVGKSKGQVHSRPASRLCLC